MTNEITNSVLSSAIVEEVPVFKQNVYLNPRTDMKIEQGREFVFIGGSPTRALFEKSGQAPTCRSWDGITSQDGQECARYNEEKHRWEPVCQYAQNVKDLPLKCTQSYNVYLEHEDGDKQYVLKLSYTAQKSLSEYLVKLHAKGLLENKVVTRITRIEPPVGKNGYMYTFEFVSELDLNITELEQETLNGIRATVATSDEKVYSVDFVADILCDLPKMKDVGITKQRAMRLAESIAVDGLVRA